MSRIREDLDVNSKTPCKNYPQKIKIFSDNIDNRQCLQSAATSPLKTGSGPSVREQLAFATLSLYCRNVNDNRNANSNTNTYKNIRTFCEGRAGICFS